MPDSNLLARGIRVIEMLSASSHDSTDDIARGSGIPRSSVYRILCVLEDLGYAIRHKHGHHDGWSLSLRFLRLTSGLLARLDIKSIVRDSLVALADETREIVQLAVLDGHHAVIIDNLQRHPSIIAVAAVGERLDVNTCASGIVLAAFANEETLNEIMEHGVLDHHTEYTITDPAEFRKLLAEVRRSGYAVDNQYYAIGHRCIGAPVLDHSGAVVAALNISGHIRTITDARVSELAERVMARAREASAKLGYDCNEISDL